MNKTGAQSGLTIFIIALVAVSAIGYIFGSAITELNTSYVQTYSVSDLSGYNNSQTLVNLTQQLDSEFNGQNSSASFGGVLAQSFDQVYTLGIVTTRIIGTITPGIFFNVISTMGNAMGITPFIIGLADIVMVLVLLSGLLYILLGRNL